MERTNNFRKMFDSDPFKDALLRPPTKFPFWVEIELTNYCNLKCIFCGQQAMTRDKGFISDKDLYHVVDECRQWGAYIQFARWGEPFLHKNIISFIEYVKGLRSPLLITTNGLAWNKKHMKAVIDNDVDWIIFSFQGATKEKYESMRNNNQYDKLHDNIVKFIKMRGDNKYPYIQITCTTTDETKQEIKDFVDYWKTVVDEVQIGKTNLSFYYDNDVDMDAVVKMRELRKAGEGGKLFRGRCSEVYTELSVNWDGSVSACCADFDKKLVVGHVDDSLYSVWNHSEKLCLIRRMLDEGMHDSLLLCSTCRVNYDGFKS